MAFARNRSSVVSTDAAPESSRTAATPSARPRVGPPRYKTAFITWLAVYPTLTLLLELIGDDLRKLALPLRTLVISAVLVPVAIYVVVPLLRRVFGSWLR
jgi:antibiotic biosynthesis monooxygenase (ABM) superfamily enzyme